MQLVKGSREQSAERRRLALAFLVSVVFHALLLSLTFGGHGLGLPGFDFPWRERRIESPDLRAVLVPAQVTAAEPAGRSVKEPLQPSFERPVPRGSALSLSVSPALTPGRPAEAIEPTSKPVTEAKPEPVAATGAAAAKAPLRSEGSGDSAPAPIPVPAVIATERPSEDTFPAPAAPVPTPAITATPSEASPGTVTPAPRDAGDTTQERVDSEARERAVELAKVDRPEQEAQRQAAQLEAARIEAARLEAARIEAARLEAERQEAARQAAARQEAARVEAARKEAERVRSAQLEAERQQAAQQAEARQEAERVEAARKEAERVRNAQLEAERQEAARQAAARQAAARREAERQEATRQAAARQAAERQETAREESARQATARQEAARVEAARREAALAEEKREERLRAIGRQLDEEAARRDATSAAARQSPSLPYSLSSARRGRLFGRTDPNAELILYAEAWARKIELNLTFDMVREAVKLPHRNPMVTVAIRSDGSVESVTFVVSSGVAEIDEAIRRVVQSQVPYQPFPPALAREYDVIEIRRTWYFDVAIRLQ